MPVEQLTLSVELSRPQFKSATAAERWSTQVLVRDTVPVLQVTEQAPEDQADHTRTRI